MPKTSKALTGKQRMDVLRKNLAKSVSLPHSFLKGLLPEWWNDSIADDAGGYFEGVAYLAKAFGLSAKEVRETEGKISPQRAAFVCKGSPDEKMDRHAGAITVACAIARLVMKARNDQYSPIPSNPLTLRRQLLAISDQIDLEALAKHCWDSGIPVIWTHRLPSPKPHAVLFDMSGRPCIVLSRKQKHLGWLLYDLAHECGHIALGHLGAGSLVDRRIEGQSSDDQEREANEWATKMLLGGIDFPQVPKGSEAVFLRSWADLYGKELKLDPRWLLIACAWHTGAYQAAQVVLNADYPGDNAPGLLLDLMGRYLDMEALTESERELLGRLVGE